MLNAILWIMKIVVLAVMLVGFNLAQLADDEKDLFENEKLIVAIGITIVQVLITVVILL